MAWKLFSEQIMAIKKDMKPFYGFQNAATQSNHGGQKFPLHGRQIDVVIEVNRTLDMSVQCLIIVSPLNGTL